MLAARMPVANFISKFIVLDGAATDLPLLPAKLLVGTLLAIYCPGVGKRHSETMLNFVALSCWIRVPEAGREK